MRQKSPYSLYRRNVGGKIIYYYITYDKAGKRLRYSTGCMVKYKAVEYLAGLFQETGSYIPSAPPVAPMRFSEYATGWWEWETCPYVRSQKESGFDIGHSYCDTCITVTEKYLVPEFGRALLGEISVDRVESWMRRLYEGTGKTSTGKQERPLSAKSVLNYLSILSVMMQEAVRLGHVDKNPCASVRRLAKNSATRGVLTVAEVKQIFSDPSAWYNQHAYVASVIASCTGMRLSEIRALRCCDVKADHLHVELSLEDTYGSKGTKTGDVRDLPLPSSVMSLVMAARGDDDSERPLLCYPDRRPYGRHAFPDGLYDVLADLFEHQDGCPGKMVVDERAKAAGKKHKDGSEIMVRYGETIRRERNITFHSWRHFLNSQLLSQGISGEKTRRITGHTTESMTRHYAHFSLADYSDVLTITEGMLKPQEKPQEKAES